MEIIAAEGPTACQAKENKRKLTKTDYDQIGLWLNEQFAEYNVSVVLMPASRFRTPFVKALERSTNWRLVFLNNNQKPKHSIPTTTTRISLWPITCSHRTGPQMSANADLSLPSKPAGQTRPRPPFGK
jgi:hypothetical protein